MSRHLAAELLARTDDTDDPVVRLSFEDTGSFMVVILPGDEPGELRVANVASRRRGDMKLMLDEAVAQTGRSVVMFLTPLDDLKEPGATTLIERLEGFEEGVVEGVELPDGRVEDIEFYRGEWRVERE